MAKELFEKIGDFLEWACDRIAFGTTTPFVSYRGHPDIKWELLPTVARYLPKTDMIKHHEWEVLNEFRSRFGLENWSDIEVLAYARHHGAPTRLLDWSRNPMVGLWFCVSDPTLDEKDGVIYQLNLLYENDRIRAATGFKLEHIDTEKQDWHILVFACPPTIERSDRQQSIFSITTFQNDEVLAPIDKLLSPCEEENSPLRRFIVESRYKKAIRNILIRLSLDEFSIYGGPDAFGKSLMNQLALSMSSRS